LVVGIELSWSAKQYVAFEDERTRPVRDLLAALPPIDAHSVIDLGCGPGNSTEVLAACYPQASVSGIDSSSDMIEAARRRLPRIRFAVEDLQAWKDAGPFDVILANAVLQWVAHHESLLPALTAKLAPGGALALQMPDNLDEPAHRLMRRLRRTGHGRPNSRQHRRRARRSLAPRGTTSSCGRSARRLICGEPLIITFCAAAPRPWWSGSKAAACGRFLNL